ncbi:MAG: L-lysine 6-transaminase [Chlorobi bacterium]|nr:L-lysine 6-transaminase [Chlorobiota bacterium]MCI0715340.1 L-lysine 6-transaminase [Chlorobiota bacterium]
METLRNYMYIDGFDVIMDLQKSQGAYIYDSRNNKVYLDLFSFVASNPLGMNHPKMNNPHFIEYIGKIALNKPSNSDIYCAEMAEFVKTFFNIAVHPHFKYVFFVEGGAVGVENALKTAFDWKVRKNFKKGYNKETGHQVIHFKQAFHGRTGYTMSLTNTDLNKTALYPKFSWPRITNPKIIFPLNENNLDEVIRLENQAIGEIKQAIKDNKDDIACMIIEPIQGEGGDNHFRKEFFEQLKTICDENEILFIVDEVQTGVGMTGKWWCHEYFVQPDIVAFGKKAQVCGILVSKRVDEVDENVFHSPSRINSTWGGNLTDMVRSKKYLEIIKEENLVENARIVGEYLLSKLNELQSKYPKTLSNARGRGLFCAIDAPNGDMRKSIIQKVFDKGVILLGSGEKSIRFRPALNIKKEHIDEGISVIDSVVKDI